MNKISSWQKALVINLAILIFIGLKFLIYKDFNDLFSFLGLQFLAAVVCLFIDRVVAGKLFLLFLATLLIGFSVCLSLFLTMS